MSDTRLDRAAREIIADLKPSAPQASRKLIRMALERLVREAAKELRGQGKIGGERESAKDRLLSWAGLEGE